MINSKDDNYKPEYPEDVFKHSLEKIREKIDILGMKYGLPIVMDMCVNLLGGYAAMYEVPIEQPLEAIKRTYEFYREAFASQKQ